MEGNNTAVKAIVVVVVLAALVGGTILLTGDDADAPTTASESSQVTTSTTQETETTQPSTNNSSSAETPSSTTSEQVSSQYADGTYSATGSYIAPPGNESLGVEVTLEGGVITAVSVDNQADHPTSVGYQNDFIADVDDLVIGVNIDEAELDQVAGSSLTSNGWNDALEQIRTQAS